MQYVAIEFSKAIYVHFVYLQIYDFRGAWHIPAVVSSSVTFPLPYLCILYLLFTFLTKTSDPMHSAIFLFTCPTSKMAEGFVQNLPSEMLCGQL